MKIYQVEAEVGITKKNIRFYEDQGLLNPSRNPQNDYREYSLEDVRILEKIKLLRKLSVPIEEIRLLQKGGLSFEQCMAGQIEKIEKEEESIKVIKELCQELRNEQCDMKNLDARKYLSLMEKIEMDGTKFADIQKEDINRKKKKGAVAGAAIFCSFMLMILGFLIYSVFSKSAPLLAMLIPIIIALAVISGTVVVLFLRLKEINSGEEYEARKY